MNDWTFIDQRQYRGPGWCVQHDEHVECIANSGWLAVLDVADQFVPESLQPQVNVAVSASDLGKDMDQVFHCVHADVAMENRPPDLKGGDQVAVRPMRRPVLAAEVTHRNATICSFSSRERPALTRASSNDRVRKIREFF